ncbi:MAG: hypothetical protein V4702_05215 [Patescibacteria group bacterium]
MSVSLEAINKVLGENTRFLASVGALVIEIDDGQSRSTAGISDVAVQAETAADDSPSSALLDELGTNVFGWQLGRVRKAHHRDAA